MKYNTLEDIKEKKTKDINKFKLRNKEKSHKFQSIHIESTMQQEIEK